MRKSYRKTCQETIRNEIRLLQERQTVLALLNLLYEQNPTFYDEDEDDIVEPYKSFLSDHSDILDIDLFLSRISDLYGEKKRKTKSKHPARTRRTK